LNIWTQIIDPFTLQQAWQKVQSNGGAAGGDGVSINQYRTNAARNIKQLATSLCEQSYQPSSCRKVEIPKRKGGVRRLMIPSIQDRILHTSIAQALQPILEPLFEDSSFAYRPGRSVQQAVAQIERWRDMGYTHVIEADIVGYFDAIDHMILLGKLQQIVGHIDGADDLMENISQSLDSQGQELDSMGRGLVQGSPLSPILANLYLDALDEAFEKRGVRIVRYADDFVILCKKRDLAEDALALAYQVLGEHGLKLHDDGTRIVDFDKGFDFIGHLFVRSLSVKKTYDDDISAPAVVVGDDAPSLPKSSARYDRGLAIMYLTDPSQSLTLRNHSFSVQTNAGHEVAAVSNLRVDRIEIGPRVSIDQQAIAQCINSDTELVFVDGRGSIKARLIRTDQERSALQMKQAETILNPTLRCNLARKFVEARIRNQRSQLFRLNRSDKKTDVIDALVAMGRNLRKLPQTETLDQIRGIEGATGALYWPALGMLTKDATFPFRRTRPATDAMNATVNYLTAILERDIGTAIQTSGLHIGFGILHAANDYSDAAIYDLMEPFRAPLTEGLASYLFNSRRLSIDDFTPIDTTGIRIHRHALRAIIKGYEQAVAKRINITGKTGKLAWRPMMQRQANDLAKAIKTGDFDAFQPYLMEA